MITYQYQKLTEPDAIRLILLQPSADLDSPLHCSLLSTSLTRCHNNLIDKYTALSYVWGDPARSRLITVNNEAMFITTSLDPALRHLRDAHRTRLVWADAICINQNDPEERNQQVKQMGWVYRQANHTIIYLGEGTPETSLFLGTLQSKSPVDWTPPSSKAGTNELVQDVSAEVEIAARKWILAQPWFNRVWILQELVLSQDPWVQCGKSVARWSCFNRHISEIATQRLLKSKEEVALNMGELRIEHRRSACQLDDDRGGDDDDLGIFAEKLYNLLKSRKGFGLMDPRDMLFANLGLISPGADDVQLSDAHLKLLALDYRKNEIEVYTDLARFFLESLGDFRIFALLGSNEKRRESQAPSWAPDWVAGRPPQFSRLSEELWVDRLDLPSKYLFWASQSRVLVCGGVFVGEVLELEPIIEQALDSQIARDFSVLAHKIEVSDQDLWHFVKSAFEEMYQKWRHLLSTSIPDPESILSDYEDQFVNNENDLRSLRDKMLNTRWPRRSRMNYREYLIARDIKETLLALVDRISGLVNITEDRRGRCLRELCEEPWKPRGGLSHSLMAQLVFSSFLTDGPNLFYSRRVAKIGNNFVALVPGAMKIGDMVSVPLEGTYRIPLVLRHRLGGVDEGLDVEIKQQINGTRKIRLEDIGPAAKKNMYRLREVAGIEHLTVVGECFVEGMMHGAFKAKKGPFQILALH
jgi:hypothetical protein